MHWPPKKTDKLEVRLPTQAKQAFLARCRSEGQSASEVVRAFIEDYLARSLTQKELSMIVRSPLTYAGLAAAAVAGVLVMSARPSMAQPDFTAIFKSLDVDGDGRLSVVEFNRKTGPTLGQNTPVADPPKANENRVLLSAGFVEIDTNGDRAVSLAEFAAFNRAAITKRFLALDSNSDGKIMLAELQRKDAKLGEPASGFFIDGAPEGFFAKFDANKDGLITEQEFSNLP